MNTHTSLIAILTTLAFVGAGCTSITPAAPKDASPTETSSTPSSTPSSKRLDLGGQGLTSVPSSTFDRRELEELDLSNNLLTGALPAEIQHLQRLRTLDASGNRMTGVPAEIGQLSALVDLDLSENALTELPMELGNLQQLRRLDLRGNDVSKQDLDAIRSKLKDTEILE